MIPGYSDHAANERTFLAWVRTGLAVLVFGFVIEKFNFFLLTLATASSVDAAFRRRLDRASGPLGRYEGLALIVLGITLIIAATVRFVRTERRLADAVTYSPASVRFELFLSGLLVLTAAGVTTCLALD
jgi:inner membrane protein YidH